MKEKQIEMKAIDIGIFMIKSRNMHFQDIRNISNSLGLTNVVSSTALAYFDRFITKITMQESVIESVMLTCLLLSSKYHQSTKFEPKSCRIFETLKKKIGEAQIKELELRVVQELDWNLDVQSPIHFIRFFLSKGRILVSLGVVFSNDIFEDVHSFDLTVKKVD